jgi:hypothetical protein
MSNNRPSFAGQAERGFAEDCATFAIGGTIWREVHSNEGVQRRPWPRLSVQIKETGRFAETDAEGRFRFYGLQPGDYWLVVRQKAIPPQAEGALLKEERITVAWPPSYDVTVPVIYREAAVLMADVTGASAPNTPTTPLAAAPTSTPAPPNVGDVNAPQPAVTDAPVSDSAGAATVAEPENPPVAAATESAPAKKPTRKRSSSTAATPPKGASEP